MAYSPLAIANYFLQKAKAENIPLTHMKLQKLVYFAHGWYLALFKKPLIDESVQAWLYGPVIYSLYSKFKAFGNDAITEVAVEPSPAWVRDDAETKEFLNKIWETYKNLTPTQLSNLTHATDGPWHRPTMMFEAMDDDEIKQYFEGQASSQS